jgi:hypothetical protein
VSSLPVIEGDRLSFEVSAAWWWKVGVLCLAGLAGAAVYARAAFGPDNIATVVEIILVAPILLLFHRHGVVCDRAARTITKWNRLLFIPWKTVVPVDGQKIRIERRLHSPDEGESYWTGHVFVGSTKLFAKSDEEAKILAQEIATFLGIACKQQQPDPKNAQREAAMPILITFGLTALMLAVYGIYRLVQSFSAS